MDPVFRKKADGSLILQETQKAYAVRGEKREQHYVPPLPNNKVRQAAIDELKKAGGNVESNRDLLGYYRIQFGQFRGETFHWILENAPGYAGYLVNAMTKDKPEPNDRFLNKMAFKKYVESFPEGVEIISRKSNRPSQPISAQPTTTVPTAVSEGLEQKTATHVSAWPTATGVSTRPISTAVSAQARSSAGSARPTALAVSTRPTSTDVSSQARSSAVSAPPWTSAVSTRPTSTAISAQAMSSALSAPLRASAVSTRPTSRTVSARATSSAVSAEPTASTISARFTASAVSSQSTASADPAHPTVACSESSNAPDFTDDDSHELLAAVEKLEQTMGISEAPSRSIPEASSGLDPSELCLPAGWKKTLSVVDHRWVSKAFFTFKANGSLCFLSDKVDKLWWYPPPAPSSPTSVPKVDRYFAHPIFFWMPRKLWKVRLLCPNPDCVKELTSSGIHQKVRHVVDIDGSYNIASEYLVCNSCKRKFIAWSHAVLTQLDFGHRCQFPCMLTSKLACDFKVVRLLRSRGLGNSSSQIQKKLVEQHSEAWMQKVLQYLTDCQGFRRAAASGMIQNITFQEPPTFQPLPKHRWLMQVYCQDVLYRLEEIKASITSVFGSILKIDSTKKIVRKLSGKAQGTAVWCTNIGNEYGQVLSSVLTAAEGSGIAPLIDGIMRRYHLADVRPPAIVYADRDCCGGSQLCKLLSAWDATVVRLDIWHFMRRISTGLTTDSHQLYGSFMDSLSNCIFEWDREDLDRLIKAKADLLETQTGQPLKEADVKQRITRKELSLHCQRRTRGEEATKSLIEKLLLAYSGAGGCDSLGVPLVNKDRMRHIWMHQQNHIACIQDPPDISLYTQTGTLKKGGHELPVYRCARGSTSLESFHLHLNRFIPGTLASDVHFQAYLLDGVFRWNQDRAESAVAGEVTEHHTYSGALQHAINTLGEAVMGKKICPTYKVPLKYTGELLGIEYLYNQTGKVIEDYKMTIAKRETDTEKETDEDDEFEDEGLGEEVDDKSVPLLEEKVFPDPHMMPSTLGQPTQTSVLQETPKKTPLPLPLDPQLEPTAPEMVHSSASPVDPPPVSDQPPLHVPLETTSKTVEPTQTSVLQETPKKTPLPLPLDPQLEPTAPEMVHRSASPVHPPPVSDQPPLHVPLETTSETVEESVDVYNRPGLQEVNNLATYLVSVKNCNALTNDQAAHIVTLWNKLNDFDKLPTAFPPRFAKVSKGRFRATKRVQGVVEGVESTKRCFLGPNQGPAQWPDCNRYTESIIVELLRIFPRDLRTSAEQMTRFGLVLSAYSRIRECILNNHIVMRDTQLQLPDINKGTLTQWFTKRAKSMDRQVLMQGVTFEQPPEASSGRPLLPQAKPQVLPTGKGDLHKFNLPEDTAGSAKLKRRRINVPETPTATPSQTFVVFEGKAFPVVNPLQVPQHSLPVQQGQAASLASSSQPDASVPYTTQRYRKKKSEQEKAGIVKRQYQRKKVFTICKKCGQDRNSGGHENYKQYFSNRYCPVTATVSYEEWLEALKAKQYGKKQKME